MRPGQPASTANDYKNTIPNKKSISQLQRQPCVSIVLVMLLFPCYNSQQLTEETVRSCRPPYFHTIGKYHIREPH